jgi:RNase P subunit RPR2
MGVFQMNTYETYQVKMAIKACRGDSILRTICIWCKKALGRYENENGLGFCYVCRRMLFPKSFAHPRIARERRPVVMGTLVKK